MVHNTMKKKTLIKGGGVPKPAHFTIVNYDNTRLVRYSTDTVHMLADLFLLLRHGLPSFRLCLKVLVHLSEVALLQVCDLSLFLGCHFLC